MCASLHAADGYIARLIRNGFKIAICDQMEAPGPGKKLVRREVVRVITPARLPMSRARRRENNFSRRSQDAAAATIGLAFVDLSTENFKPPNSAARAEESLREELQLLHPRETLLPRPQQLFDTAKTALLDVLVVSKQRRRLAFQNDYAARILREQFGSPS